MKIYHLNCGSMTAKFPKTEAVTYCLLVETNQGLILVDTGMGRQDYTNPSALMRLFSFWVGVHQKMEETAIHQVKELGFQPEDVTHIVLTHMHLDHAGGLPDFPHAKVHLHKREYEAVMNPKGIMERAYLPVHWAHHPDWMIHDKITDNWYGLDAIRILDGLNPQILLVPLHGHTRGHCGVAIATEAGWLLHCGDAASPLHPDSDLHGRKENDFPAKYLPGKLVRSMLGEHVPKLRNLLTEYGSQIEIISSHDIYSLKYYQEQT